MLMVALAGRQNVVSYVLRHAHADYESRSDVHV
jgi:hypothetical protein